MALGSYSPFLLSPIHVPANIYPAKGYSATIDIGLNATQRLAVTRPVEELVAAFVGLKAPPAEPEPSLYSITKLHEVTGLDRTTIKERLEGIPSTPGTKNAKLYALADALPALIKGRDVTIDEVKLKRESAKAQREELALNRELEKVVDRAEMSGELQKLWKALHNRLAVQLWRDLSATLFKAKTVAELADLGQAESQKTFDALRSNYKSLF